MTRCGGTVATNSLYTFLIMYRIVGISGVSASLKTYIEIPVDSAVLYSALLVGMDYQFYAEKRLLPVYVRLVSSGITVCVFSSAG